MTQNDDATTTDKKTTMKADGQNIAKDVRPFTSSLYLDPDEPDTSTIGGAIRAFKTKHGTDTPAVVVTPDYDHPKWV